MTQKERMEAGLIYDPGDDEIMTEQVSYLDLLYEFIIAFLMSKVFLPSR